MEIDREKVLYGLGFIYKRVVIINLKFHLKAFSNLILWMELLYVNAIKMADLKKFGIIIDAYSGVGTISIFLSK